MNDLEVFYTLFSLVVTLAGQPQGADPTALGPKVLVVGDSNVGTTVTGELARRASLRPNPWRVMPVSTSGSGLHHQSYWLPHLAALVEAECPNAVVINLGANDAGEADFIDHLTDVAYQALALAKVVPASTPVVFVGVPPDINAAGAAAWLNLYALPWVAAQRPLTWVVQSGPGRLGEDHLHYTDEGGRITGAEVYSALQIALGETTVITTGDEQ